MTLIKKIKIETYCRPIVFLSLFILSVVVLGTISLCQYRELEQVRYVSRLENQHQSNRTDFLQQEWSQVKNNFNQQIEMEIARRLNERLAQTDTANQQQLRYQEQIAELARYARGSEEIVAEFSSGVCLIQGAYMFVDPKTELPLRYTSESAPQKGDNWLPEAGAGEDRRQTDFSYAVSIHGQGKPLLVEYTGTGFLVDPRGYLLTNKHVTTPWEVSREYQPILKSGYEPRLYLFQVFFPNQSFPLQAEIIDRSDTEDVALLYANLAGLNYKPLICEENPDQLKVGETVLVLGYPTGFDVLLARLSDQELSNIFGSEELNFEQIACHLARHNLIQPVATRGMCGRVSQGKITYDAQTAMGGSGAPVFGCDGKVVAINTALMKGFPGTNFGIPIQEGLKLLRKQKPAQLQTNIAENPSRPAKM